MKKGKNIDGNIKIFHKIPNFDVDTNSIGINSLTDLQLEAYGYFDVIDNPITVYQRYGKLLPEHLVGNQYITPIEDFTAQEVIDYDLQQIVIAEQQLANDASAQIEMTFRQDGEQAYNRIKYKIKRANTDGTITKPQYKLVRKFLSPAIYPLNFGDWDIAQDNLNALTPPTNAKLLFILNKVKQIVNDYIIENNI